jgi:hypothetical protein
MGGLNQFPAASGLQQDQLLPLSASPPPVQFPTASQQPPSAPQGNAVGSTQDLEQQGITSHQMLASALQNQQTQLQDSQTQLVQAQQQINSPLQKALQRESDAIDQAQARGHGFKQMLMSFLSGGGAALANRVGIMTPEQQQENHVHNIISLSNASAIDALRAAQVQNMQLVTRQMPDGSLVQIPQGHVATFDAAMARSYEAQQKPDIKAQIYRNMMADLQANRDPNLNPQTLQLIQLDRSMQQKEQPDTAATQKNDFMQGIQKMVTAGEFTPDMQTSSVKFTQGVQNSQVLTPQEKAALVAYQAATTTPASQGTQAAIKINLEDQNKQVPVYDTKNANSLTYLSPAEVNARNAVEPGRYTQAGQIASGAKTGYAFDPQTQQTVLTNPQEAAQRGFTAFRPVKETDIRADQHDIKILNDVAVKGNNVISSAAALDQPQQQRNIIGWAIDQGDQALRIGAFGTQLPTAWLNNLINSKTMSGASQLTRDYVVSTLSLREASMGMQRLLTGTARANESQIKALQATLPGLEPDSKLVKQKMAAFTQNLDMLRQGLPQLPGITSIPIQSNTARPIMNQGSTAGNLLPSHSPTYSYNPGTDSLTPTVPAAGGNFFSQFGGQARQ